MEEDWWSVVERGDGLVVVVMMMEVVGDLVGSKMVLV